MMRFNAQELAEIIGVKLPPECDAVKINDICTDSRQVRFGALFIAIQGAQGHGRVYQEAALKNGASVILLESEDISAKYEKGILYLAAPKVKERLGGILNAAYQSPSHRLHLIGITGTNGKTTLAYLLEDIFKQAGHNPGVIGTITHRCGGDIRTAGNTTPGQADLYRLLDHWADQGATHVVMEVSSHALDQGRTEGLNFRQAVFTNLTGDHLDYHQDMESYFQAKAKLFTSLQEGAVAIINQDDTRADQLNRLVNSQVLTYGLRSNADYTAQDISYTLDGTNCEITTPQGKKFLNFPLIGIHNLSNCLAAVAVAECEGVSLDVILEGLKNFKSVPGRLEPIDAGQDYHVFVDYAHTDDALSQVLTGLRQISPSPIRLVFGCGGDRDQSKRSRMGRVAARLADEIILTSDNPRTEDPLKIINDIEAGLDGKKCLIEPDRERAIELVLHSARPGDVVLIAGKGHEDYQIIGQTRREFDDRETVRKFLACPKETEM